MPIAQVSSPYYFVVLSIVVTQIILRCFTSAPTSKHAPTQINKVQIVYLLIQVVSCWATAIGIFGKFPLSRFDGRGTNGWFDYNVMVYVLSYSSPCLTGLQYLVNALMELMKDKGENAFELCKKTKLAKVIRKRCCCCCCKKNKTETIITKDTKDYETLNQIVDKLDLDLTTLLI